MAYESKYDYTDVVVTAENYNAEKQTYLGSVKTKSFGELTFRLKKLNPVKTTANGFKIVAEVTVNDGDEIGIFEGEDKKGNKTFGGTVRKQELFINIKPIVTTGDIKSYKVTFVEAKGLTPTVIANEEFDDTF